MCGYISADRYFADIRNFHRLTDTDCIRIVISLFERIQILFLINLINSIKLTVIIDSPNDDNDEKFRPTVRIVNCSTH